MKLLKGEVQTVEEDGIKLGLKVIDTVMQATITAMTFDVVDGKARAVGLDGLIKRTGYILRNCIESVEIGGVSYTPSDLAVKADISDHDTLKAMINIGRMVYDAALPDSEELKK